MCGFTGWYDENPHDLNVLTAMTDAIAHRGPDAFGYYHGRGPVALGHRRLSIIDLAASVQPMYSADGRYVIAYNGELYNFLELKEELIGLGHRFITSGDTEVLLQALIQWGSDVLPRLQGMFAFAFWDSEDNELLLARDHFGVKPLHYSWNGKRLLFGSEIKALLPHPTLSREIDPNAIRLYLECQYIPAPYSIYREIKKLLPGHQLRIKKGQIEIKRYWQLSYSPKLDLDEETAMEMLEKELRKSVSSMLVSDVPIGAFVSGGIDSSLIAALMQQKKTKIFNICFDKPLRSEHEYAIQVANHIGAEYHPLAVQTGDMIQALGSWSDTFDEPFGDQAALPTLLLAQLTKKHVTVVLTGEGADEILAGYSNYPKRLKEAPLSALLGGKYSPFPFLHQFLPPVARKNRVFKAAARPLSRRYATIPNLFDREIHSSILTADFADPGNFGLDKIAEGHFFECDSDEYLDKMLHIDTSLWLSDDLLAKVDRATMAHSLEARVPYLDHKFVEFVAKLPTNFKLKDGICKYLLKQMGGRGLLPPDIAHRPKQGFVMPLREWLGAELKPLLDEALATLEKRNLFQPGYIDKLRKEEASRKRLHATRIWSLLVLELWFRKYSPEFKIPSHFREG